MTMPTAPIWLPRRAVAGEERNRNARMKATIVTRYARSVACLLILLRGLPLLEHLEHPVGDDESADDVGRRQHDRYEPDDVGIGAVRPDADGQHGAHDHDPVDRVGA